MGGGNEPSRGTDLSTIVCAHRRRWHEARREARGRLLILFFLLLGTALVVVSLVWGYRAQNKPNATTMTPQSIQP